MDTSITVAWVLERQHEHLAKDIALGPESVSFASLVYDAAALAIEQEKPRDPVEILEQGRGLLFNQLGRYRTCLDNPQGAHRDLADQFKDLSAQLESSVVSGSRVSVGGARSKGGRRSIDEPGR